MSVVLVTGGTGFVGSHLVRRLVSDGHEVHMLCRAQSNFHRLPDVLPRIRRHEVNLLDRVALDSCIEAISPRHVYHLAAATIVAGTPASAAELVNVNLLGTVNLVDACRAAGCEGMVTTGDSFEYSATHDLLDEESACRPDTLHGITKLAATLFAQAAAASLPIVTLRLFSTYGPADNPRRLLPKAITSTLRGERLLLSRPEIARDWVFIDDLIELYVEAAGRADALRGGVFNAGSGLAVSFGEIVQLVAAITGRPTPAEWGMFPAPAHDDTPWIANTRRTFAAFAWRPTTSLEAGLDATIAALRDA